MNKKIKSIISTLVFTALIFGFSSACYLKGDTLYSLSERRAFAKAPEISGEALASGKFMKEFETYTADQFPLREGFRGLKSVFSIYGLRRLDNNGLFAANGHISKLDDAKNDYMQDYAAKKFKFIYDSFIDGKGANVYFSIVPDKNAILAPQNGYPSLDYKAFVEDMKKRTEYMEYIDIAPLLSLDDYYTTDSHWRQEKIIDVARELASKMGTDIDAKYEVNTLENPFYGVYYGQLGLPFEPDTIKYLTSDAISNAKVNYYDTGMPKSGDMYNMEKAFGKDPYEMFLSGVAPVVTIENENAKTQKELVILRDSFGSSLAPLFAEGYKKITVIDIRYVMSNFVGNFASFENADVLFIYSTTILNNSTAMK